MATAAVPFRLKLRWHRSNEEKHNQNAEDAFSSSETLNTMKKWHFQAFG
jgi:hypothetical protein